MYGDEEGCFLGGHCLKHLLACALLFCVGYDLTRQRHSFFAGDYAFISSAAGPLAYLPGASHLSAYASVANVTVQYLPCEPVAACMKDYERTANMVVQMQRTIWWAKRLNYCFVLLANMPLLNRTFAVPEDGVLRLEPGWDYEYVNESSCALTCKNMHCRQPNISARLAQTSNDTEPTVDRLRQIAVENILPYLRCNGTEVLPEGTLLIHLRGGDLHNRWNTRFLNGFYVQPPCSYWLEILQKGYYGKAFPRVHVIVEPGKPPFCLGMLRDYLAKNYKASATYQSKTVLEDACTMTHVRHLAMGYGTWGHAMAHLNPYLEDLFVPFGEDENTTYTGESVSGWHWLQHDVIHERGLSYNQHVYSFPGFPTKYKHFNDKVMQMTRYKQERILTRIIPATNESAPTWWR